MLKITALNQYFKREGIVGKLAGLARLIFALFALAPSALLAQVDFESRTDTLDVALDDTEYSVELKTDIKSDVTFSVEDTQQGTATSTDYSFITANFDLKANKYQSPKIVVPIKVLKNAKPRKTIILKLAIAGQADKLMTITLGKRNYGDFLMVNVEKTVVGKAPSGEFSEVTAKLSYTQRWFGFYSVDVGIGDTTKVKKDVAILNQAMVSFNRSFRPSRDNNRQFFLTALMKVFNYEPYIGAGLGSFEFNPKSELFTTYFILSYLHSFYKQNLGAPKDFYTMDNIFFHHNMYLEFAIKLNKNTNAGFLTNARLKAAALVPLNVQSYGLVKNGLDPYLADKNGSDFVRVRIMLQIPVGDVIPIR